MTSYQFDTSGPVDLAVRIAAGEVHVVTRAGGECDIQVECPDDPEYAERVTVRHSGRHGRTWLVVVEPRDHSWRSWTGQGRHLEITATVPEGSGLDARTASADVTAEGRLQWLRATTASGRVRADEVLDSLNVRTASGEVSVGTLGGSAVVKTASGDVTVHEAAGPVRAATASGDVQVDSTDSSVSAKTATGSVTVAVAPGTTVQVDAQTVSGELTSDIPLGRDLGSGPAEHGQPARLTVRTVSGDVRIARAADADAA